MNMTEVVALWLTRQVFSHHWAYLNYFYFQQTLTGHCTGAGGLCPETSLTQGDISWLWKNVKSTSYKGTTTIGILAIWSEMYYWRGQPGSQQELSLLQSLQSRLLLIYCYYFAGNLSPKYRPDCNSDLVSSVFFFRGAKIEAFCVLMILSWSQSWAARNERYSDTVITKNNDFSIYIRLDKIRYILQPKFGWFHIMQAT